MGDCHNDFLLVYANIIATETEQREMAEKNIWVRYLELSKVYFFLVDFNRNNFLAKMKYGSISQTATEVPFTIKTFQEARWKEMNGLQVHKSTWVS